MNELLISVVIPTYNRAKMLCDCVESVLATEYPNLEVIVVDDCSPDDTKGEMERRFGGDGRVRYVRHSHNRLLAAARNTGGDLARGDYIFFLDDDNKVSPNVIVELLAAFRRHPGAGMVAPLAIHDRPTMENAIWALGFDFNPWTSKPCNKAALLPIEQLPEEPLDYQTKYSCNAFMVSRDAYRATGGADESLVMVYEESDFGYRLCEAGYEAWIATRAKTVHYGYLDEGSVQQLRLLGLQHVRRTYYFARNRLRFARRHFSFLQQLSVTLVFAPLSAVYYCSVALKNRRLDIAWAYFRGTLAGILGL